MTVYENDVTSALQPYANQFDSLEVEQRRPVIDLNGINPLSELRDEYQNVTSTQTEYKLSTTANTNDTAFLKTKERGQYVPGTEGQVGFGTRVPNHPTGDTTARWGYFEVDANDVPQNGFAFGVDSTGVFVASYRNGSVEQKVYRPNWNGDTLDGSGDLNNPSGDEMAISEGNIFQIEYIYYGYGPVKMSVVLSDDDGIEAKKTTVHEFRFKDQTSIQNTNLPITQHVVSGGTTNDAIDLYVGGRQYSIIGNESSNNRRNSHYRDELTAVDDTQWYPAISIKLKDGTDIGNIDFTHVLAETINVVATNGSAAMRMQLRRGVTLDQSTWQTPTSAIDKTDETAVKVDTTATSITDGSGNLTGVSIDNDTVESGNKNSRDTTTQADSEERLTDGQVMTLLFKAQPGQSGTISAIQMKWLEKW